MARILRGGIYWANLNPVVGNEQAGLRPVLVLSKNVFNKHSGTIIGVALTSQPQKASFPLTLELKSSGLPKKSWVKISQIRTLSIKRLGKKIGKVSDAELNIVVEGFHEIVSGQQST